MINNHHIASDQLNQILFTRRIQWYFVCRECALDSNEFTLIENDVIEDNLFCEFCFESFNEKVPAVALAYYFEDKQVEE